MVKPEKDFVADIHNIINHIGPTRVMVIVMKWCISNGAPWPTKDDIIKFMLKTSGNDV